MLTSVKFNTRSSANLPSARFGPHPKVHGKNRITERLRAQIVERYKQGDVGTLQVAEEFGVSKSSVLNILKREGIAIRKQGHRLT
ncbi:helix-turn-helix domain-containing protein [Aeromicrobium sp. Root344]|uniref:helix-turn-helix domain-containing protein n=1 Tax=Aeromicrobium sp. Root344 TaxID=1736521 RepID=UPI000AAC85CD